MTASSRVTAMAYKILLDAGHFGKTNKSPCRTSIQYYESDFTWSLHNLLKAELLRYGFVVGVTRTDKSKDLQVYDRGEMAKGYDLFLSLHSNAASTKVLDGVDRPVIIYPVKADSKEKSFADKIGKAVYGVMKTEQPYQLFQREYPGYPGFDYYGVLRGAIDAGCKYSFIIEHGFHTDTRCTEWLLNSNNRKALAVAEAKMIADWFGVSALAVQPTPTGKTVYRVQVGAFSQKRYAEAMCEDLKKHGYDPYIVESKE